MINLNGLAALKRRDGDVMYIHQDCNQELKFYPGLQNTDQQPIVLKCDRCEEIVGEWSTEEERNRELEEFKRKMVPADMFYSKQPRLGTDGPFLKALGWMTEASQSDAKNACEAALARINQKEALPGDQALIDAYHSMQWPPETDDKK